MKPQYWIKAAGYSLLESGFSGFLAQRITSMEGIP